MKRQCDMYLRMGRSGVLCIIHWNREMFYSSLLRHGGSSVRKGICNNDLSHFPAPPSPSKKISKQTSLEKMNFLFFFIYTYWQRTWKRRRRTCRAVGKLVLWAKRKSESISRPYTWLVERSVRVEMKIFWNLTSMSFGAKGKTRLTPQRIREIIRDSNETLSSSSCSFFSFFQSPLCQIWKEIKI